MAEDAATSPDPGEPGPRRSFWRRWIIFPFLLILTLAFIAFWVQRKDIADNVIASALASKGVQATYEVERIGGRRQVLKNIIIGDPTRPDLTVERAEVVIRYRLGLPGVASLKLVRPRLFGTYYGGKLSFGALDPLVFSGSTEPFEFPNMTLDLVDGRALLESEFGPIGMKAEGKGHLRGGFSGKLAATAPRLAGAGCDASRATLYGSIGIDAERPQFQGPLRLAGLTCVDAGVDLAETAISADLRLDRDMAGIEAGLIGQTHGAKLAAVTLESLVLKGKAIFRDAELTASYDVGTENVNHPQASLAAFTAKGTVRAGDRFDWVRVDGEFAGSGIKPGSALDKTLADMAKGANETFAAALLRKLRGAIQREAQGSTLSGLAEVRRTGDVLAVVIPEAQVSGGTGEKVLAVSRLQYGASGDGTPRIAGNFSTGGHEMPRIEGRIERRGGSDFAARLTMAEYSAEGGKLAIPGLSLVSSDDKVGFAGRALMSGELPGGFARDLEVPLNGNWSSAGGLALWRDCTDLRFAALRFANLELDRRSLKLCPARGQPIVRYDGRGLKIAAGAPSLDVSGRLGQTPIAIASGPVGIAYPGTIAARSVRVSLGPRDTASTFALSNLSANVGKGASGSFDGTDVKLFAVPLDLLDASGNWSYSGGVLRISDGAFRLIDRQKEARFEPLVSRDATLSLENNVILANAEMREPASGRTVTIASIHHDLGTGRGFADLAVPGIVFDSGLQPEALSHLALGVVANVNGTVTGLGRIDWDELGVTSAGSFSSDSLDFAAAFGPVTGASGTVRFTDLLGLTTAPDQRFKIKAINPGIEVYDGEIGIEVRNGEVLAVTGGTWPFMGGTLTLRPVALNIGVSEERTYVLDIKGLEASQFVQRMDLSNISADGVFDGSLPLVFDTEGNGRIVNGELAARGPGNVSYVGALTYEDMGAIANFAFDALKSLDYDHMTVVMNGPLTGEIVTQVRFEGVRQGEGAKKNFITRRLGNLPIRFVVNIRASFYQLLSNLKSLYDPSAVKDPRDASVGLLDKDGNVIRRPPANPPMPAPPPGNQTANEPPIQRRESEVTP
ncbi:exoprotein [Altererythrobacter salegens]|uniref:Exoprotein n=1 Tax=Croceibacterium salegens TaxID=1737568 RepID=A0A6I4SUP6_9SPHN|nr:YdbH domain-containing protein [Croceibacterium salegens]MXO59159.1 exoprotein [Croceibacterium salegens]